MNVDTITMDPQEARDRLREYRTALHRSADEEYRAAAAGYEALADGTPLLRYGPAIANAPRDEKHRPMLAIARADRTQVCVSASARWQGSVIWFDCTARFRQAVAENSLLLLDVPTDRPHALQMSDGYALVPMVPPHALNACGGRSRLRDHLVLWEIEGWADRPIQAVPDRDPYLLRPIHGDLCAVVAEWDLTELERSVMAGRAGA